MSLISLSASRNELFRVSLLAVLVGLPVVKANSADSPTLHPAVKATPPAIHATVDVNNKFSEGMGTEAGLDRENPQFSSDGVQWGQTNGQSLASAECLLAETVVASKNSYTNDSIKAFCESLKSSGAVNFDSSKSALEEHAGSRIDDAIIHLVVWSKGKADGTWYQYSRHTQKWSGTLHSFALGDAVTAVDHIMGHGNVAFLAIHLGVDDSCKISYDIEAKHTKPLNQQDVSYLIQLAESYYNKGKSSSKPQGGAAVLGYNASAQPAPYWGVWGGLVLLKYSDDNRASRACSSSVKCPPRNRRHSTGTRKRKQKRIPWLGPSARESADLLQVRSCYH
jgi:hypothetical protein